MAVKTTPAQIGVASGAGLTNRFSVDDRAAMQSAQAVGLAANRLGAAIQTKAEDEMRLEADKAAREGALSATLERDPETGVLKVSEPPASFGPYARAIFDKAILERTASQTIADHQTQLDQIAVQNRNDPARATALLQAHTEGALASMDPRVRGAVGARLTSEAAERSRGVMNRVAQEQQTALERQLVTGQNEHIFSAQDMMAAGNEAGADAELVAMIEKQRSLVALNQAHPDSIADKERLAQAVKASAQIIGAFNAKLVDGTLMPEDLQDLRRAALGQLTENERVLGFDAQWIRENLRDPAIRQGLERRLGHAGELLREKWARMGTEAVNALIEANVQAGGRSRPANITEQQWTAAITTWARENNVNVQTAEGLNQVFQRYGPDLPAEIVRINFANAADHTPERLRNTLEAYRMMQAFPREGGAVDLSGRIDPKDLAFLEHLDRQGGAVDANAIERARRAVSENLTLSEEGQREKLRQLQRDTNGQPITDRELQLRLDRALGAGANATLQMQPDLRRTLTTLATQNIMMGMPVDRAISAAANRFRTMTTRDENNVMLEGAMAVRRGGVAFIDRRDMPPALPVPNGAPGQRSHQWVNQAIDKAIGRQPSPGDDENGLPLPAPAPDTNWRLQDGTALPADAQGGKNVFLTPVTRGSVNPRYQLVYLGPGDAVPRVITDENNRPVNINLGAVARNIEQWAGGVMRDRAQGNWRQDAEVNDQIRETMRGTALRGGFTPQVNTEVTAPNYPIERRDMFVQDAPRTMADDPLNPRPNSQRGGAGSGLRLIRPGDGDRQPDVTMPERYAPQDVPPEGGRPSSFEAVNGRMPWQLRPPTTQAANTVMAVTEQPERRARPDGYGQQLTGAITVNGNTYRFVNGGGGRGSIPFGEYTISNFRSAEVRAAAGMRTLGDTFDLSDVRDDLAGGTRSALRIHRSAGRGTEGCIGIVGDEATWKRFVDDMKAAGPTKLVLGPPGGGERREPSPAIRQVEQQFNRNTGVATEYFLGRGYSPAQVAGIVGNLFVESAGMNPAARGDPQVPGGSHGLPQWNRTRLAGLRDFAQENGIDPRAVGTQLAYIEKELETTEAGVRAVLRTSRTVEEATQAFVGYHRPRGFSWTNPRASMDYDRREQEARKIFRIIGAANG